MVRKDSEGRDLIHILALGVCREMKLLEQQEADNFRFSFLGRIR